MSTPENYTRAQVQKLIDACFEMVVLASYDPRLIDPERAANFVRANLRELGFPTRPVGSSHGVLE